MKFPGYEPTFTLTMFLGICAIYFGALAIFMAYFFLLDDGWKKNAKTGLAITLLPWSVIGLLILPLYAITKYENAKQRPLLAVLPIIGVGLLWWGWGASVH